MLGVPMQCASHIVWHQPVAAWFCAWLFATVLYANNNASISGTVTGPDGTTPLVDIRVTASRHDGMSIWFGFPVYTSTNGHYAFSNLEAGTYRIHFKDDSGVYAQEWYDDVAFSFQYTHVAVGAGAQVTGIDASLHLATHITGQVTASGGDTLSNISVRAYRQHMDQWSSYEVVHTDHAGLFELRGMRAGSYRVGFTDWSGVYARQYYSNSVVFATATPMETEPGMTMTNINASLIPASRITGNVTEPDGTTPIPDVVVNAYQWNGDWWDNVASDYTDEFGVYDIGGLSEGDHRVGFQHLYGLYIPEFYEQADNVDDATYIPVGESTIVSNINASLSLASFITGAVTAPDGMTPVEGISVDIFEPAPFMGGVWWVGTGGMGFTDEQGHFSVGGLKAGTYRIRFRDSSRIYANMYYDGVFHVDEATDIVVPAATTVSDVNIALVLAGHIAGVVSNSEEAPLPNVNVTAYTLGDHDAQSTVQAATTDHDGNYIIRGLSPDTYRVGFHDPENLYADVYYDNADELAVADDIMVSTGGTVSNVNAVMPLGARISGTVTIHDGGAPLTNAVVHALREQAEHWHWEGSAHTAQDGTYEIGGLRAGTYRVSFYHPSGSFIQTHYDQSLHVGDATHILVDAGDMVTNINASLAFVSRIQGTITELDGVTPIMGVTATAYLWGEYGWLITASAQTDEYGQYDIGSLWEGVHRVGFHDTSGGYAPTFYDEAEGVITATDIPVGASETVTGINASLTPASFITGRVTGSDGETPLEGIHVSTGENESIFADPGMDIPPSAAISDANGHFSIGGLAAGAYRLQFFDPSGEYAGLYYEHARDSYTATEIMVPAATTVSNINISLPRLGRMAGTVRNVEELPLSDIEVIAYWSNEHWWGRAAAPVITDQDGHYLIEGLFPDTYRVGFSDPGNEYAAVYYDGALEVTVADDVVVPEGVTVSNINITMITGARISGRVTEQVGGTPLTNAYVAAIRDLGGEYWGWQWEGGTETGDDGMYEISGLREGTYVIRFGHELYASMYYDGVIHFIQATELHVGDSEIVTNINASLAPASSISGTVTGPGGVALSGQVSISIYVWDGSMWGSVVVFFQLGTNGHYSLGGLSAGDYRVGHSPETTPGNMAPYRATYYVNAPDVESATTIEVGVGETVSGIDFQLFFAQPTLQAATAPVSSEGGLPVRWSSFAGQYYAVDRATNLLTGFTRINTLIPATPPLNVFMDGTATNGITFFYRVVIDPDEE